MKPVKDFRAGGVSASVWMNKTVKLVDGVNKEKVFPTVKVVRNYTDKQGAWKETNSFRVSDLPDIIAVLQEAYADLRVKVSSEKKVVSSSHDEFQGDLDKLAVVKEYLSQNNLRVIPNVGGASL